MCGVCVCVCLCVTSSIVSESVCTRSTLLWVDCECRLDRMMDDDEVYHAMMHFNPEFRWFWKCSCSLFGLPVLTFLFSVLVVIMTGLNLAFAFSG